MLHEAFVKEREKKSRIFLVSKMTLGCEGEASVLKQQAGGIVWTVLKAASEV